MLCDEKRFVECLNGVCGCDCCASVGVDWHWGGGQNVSVKVDSVAKY